MNEAATRKANEITCAGPDCGASLEGGPASRRFCSTKCRKAAHRDRERATRPAAAGAARTKRQPPEHRETAAAEYARDLERETAASLRRDPDRWAWRRTTETRDNRRRKAAP